ncbi:MAG: P-II family nitrogen regulator [Magnetococcales bacterium]|nr:P-II family nitrogen regulator [Magnetococcales bacterium]MBF0437492.1 P-II family nitrogen regulator [Magnetococcales bacterium]
MEFQLVICMVKTELTDQIVRAVKAAGASGSTVIAAQGTGINEAKTFFGLDLNLQTDVIIFFLEAGLAEHILDVIEKVGQLDQHGTGIAMNVPVIRAVGIEPQLAHFKRLAKHPSVMEKQNSIQKNQ